MIKSRRAVASKLESVQVTLHPPVATTNSAPPPQHTSPGSCSTCTPQRETSHNRVGTVLFVALLSKLKSPARSAVRRKDGSCRRAPWLVVLIKGKIQGGNLRSARFWLPLLPNRTPIISKKEGKGSKALKAASKKPQINVDFC